MEVTDEMIEAFAEAEGNDSGTDYYADAVKRGLTAVLNLIDAVPAEVTRIVDGQGDEWERNPRDPMVWICDGMFRTAATIAAKFEGITWEGRA